VLADPVRGGSVAVVDGRVAAVGPREDLARSHGALPEVDLGDAVLAPGLVDAHCHLEWALLGGLLPPAPFHEWLSSMLALRGRVGPETARTAARLGALRCLEHGTTTVVDSGPLGAGVAALSEVGLRGLVLLEVTGRERGAEAAERAARVADEVAALRDAAGPRVRVGVGPHAPYSVGPELWRALGAERRLGTAPTGCHLAESRAEHTLIASGGGPLALLFAAAGIEPAAWPGPPGESPAARLARAGGLRPGMLAAHCVHLAPGDAALLGEHDVRPVLCPTSNARLACGAAPVERMLRGGCRPALGTDSPASAGPFDMRAEARALALSQGAAGNPIAAADLLRMATADGADALGFGDLGRLTPGARADMVAVGIPPEAAPGDPAEAFLHPLGRVVVVAVEGRALVWEGHVVDASHRGAVEAAAAEARAGLC
jgi:5-methylthioadenosine/S-adenosylhomocysteine deaminase